MLLVEVAGAGDEHTLAGAARTLAARVEAGRAALSERERAVFTRFVLGGVAEELRRRVNQADQLIEAMRTAAAYLLAEPIWLDKPSGAASTRLRGGYGWRSTTRADPCRAPGGRESVPESRVNIDAVPRPRGPVTFWDLSLRQFVVTQRTPDRHPAVI